MAERFALQHIDKRFGSVHALRDVDFVLHAGQVHPLLGEPVAIETPRLVRSDAASVAEVRVIAV